MQNISSANYPLGAVLSSHNMDDLLRLRNEAMAAGQGSGRWIKCAIVLIDVFPALYQTAKVMNEEMKRLRGINETPQKG